jgi:hypothetical protein
MSDRPVAKYEGGLLWLDDAGVYCPASRMSIAIMAKNQSTLRCPEAREVTRQCQEALKQYAAMEEAK